MKSNNTKKSYQAPQVEQIKLDIEISMVMTSPPPPNPQMPQNPYLDPSGFVQKIIRFGWWNPLKLQFFGSTGVKKNSRKEKTCCF